MSALLSPPPASISIDWTSTLSRSCGGMRSPRRRDPRRERFSEAHSVRADPRKCSPTWPTTCKKMVATTRRRVL